MNAGGENNQGRLWADGKSKSEFRSWFLTSRRMEKLSGILSATLSIDAATRRNAERALSAVQAEPDFAHSVLLLAQSSTAPPALRQSATLAFKNWIKLNYAVSPPFPAEIRDDLLTKS